MKDKVLASGVRKPPFPSPLGANDSPPRTFDEAGRLCSGCLVARPVVDAGLPDHGAQLLPWIRKQGTIWAIAMFRDRRIAKGERFGPQATDEMD